MASTADRIAPPRTANRKPQRLRAATIERVLSAIVMIGVAATIAIGWFNRKQVFLDPEQGWGYALGIIGGTLMLILLGYPLRKRVRLRSRKLGSVGFWFRLHMLLGLVGPTAILFHSRFSFGSFNSTVALGAMIVVAGSGLVGRLLYSRVHRGFSGRKLELQSLKGEMDDLLEKIGESADLREAILRQLEDFEEQALGASVAYWSSARAVVGLSLKSRLAERRIARELTGTAGERANERLSRFFEAVRRTAEFAFFERLLRLWHLLHMPLFVMLVAAALLHILAVHMY